MSREHDVLLADDAGVTRGSVVSFGQPSDEEMAAINRMASTTLSPAEVCVIDCIPTDTSLDSYFTHQDPATSLVNYAEDATAGVPILNSHGQATAGWTDLPIGRSLSGAVVSDDTVTPRGAKVHATKTKPVVYSAYYLPRGLQTSSTPNDSIIRAVETGVLRDVSIGFGNAPGRLRGNGYWYRCDECGNDGLRSQDCTHFPGQTLTRDDGTRRRVTWTVMDAGLREYSPVWRGANPSAKMLRKAGELVTRGVLSYADITEIDAVTGRHMAAALDWEALKRRQIVSKLERTADPHDTPPPAGTQDPDEARRGVLDEALAGDQPPAPPTPPAAPPEGQRAAPPPVAEEHPFVEQLRTAGVADAAGLETVLRQAEDGRRYRADLEDIFHKAGVRAYGTAYRQDAHARTLAAASTDDLLALIDERNQVARERFAKDRPGEDKDAGRDALANRYGGRQTLPQADPLGVTSRTDQTTQGTRAEPGEDDSRLFTVGDGKRNGHSRA